MTKAANMTEAEWRAASFEERFPGFVPPTDEQLRHMAVNGTGTIGADEAWLTMRVVMLTEMVRLQSIELARMHALLSTPRTDEFFEAVRTEAAHQIDRWGVEHDAGKRPEDWIALLVYLFGKAAKAHYERDVEKLKHHVITGAAVCLNWFRNLVGDTTAMRPGIGP